MCSPGPGGYYLHWAIEIPAESLFVVRDPALGRHGAVFIASVQVTARDDPEAVLHDDRAESFFAVGREQAAALARPFLFRGAVPVIPGEHDLRLVLRNRACPSRDEADCRHAYTVLEGPFSAPEVQFETPSLTPPVLAHGSERLGGEPRYRGYRFGRTNLLPNPSGVFAAVETLTVLSEPLNAPAGARIEWTVSLAPDSGPGPPPPAPRSGSVMAHGDREGPLVLTEPLAGLPGGRYRFALRLLSGDGAELARREVRFRISPRAAIARPLVDGALGESRPELPGAVELARARQWSGAGNPEAARALAAEAVRLGPELLPAREFLARLRLEDDDPAGAAALLGEVFAAHPDRYDTARALGEARVRTGAFDTALAPLTRALELRPPDADLLVLLATTHLVLGDEEAAARFLDRAAGLDPENERVRALRRR